jgi:dihydrofolate synthase/folylpolyglutamate synthase
VTIRNLREAEAALLPYVPLVKQLTGKDTTLDRVQPLMRLLGNPQDKLKTIHVAGTSGKTSMAYYMAALLEATGKKVGLAVSPHVDSITERVQLAGRPLAEATFCSELSSFLDIVKQLDEPPSYFELLYSFAIWVFGRQGADYAVIETGMGGLYDATNVTTRADKVCVITDIGFDHTHLLGNTLPEIAAQKVGIVHGQNHVFMYQQADEIMAVVEQWAKQHRAPLHIISEEVEQRAYQDDLDIMPDYQRRNWLLAHNVYQYLKERDNLPNLTSQALRKTQHIQIPGRMDIRQVSDKTLVMDGAHNAQKMTAFIRSFQQLYPGVKPAVLLALKESKDYRELGPLLVPLAARIIVTTFETSQDLPVVSMDPEQLAQALRAAGVADVESIVDRRAAYQALLAAPENVCVITGSFYLLGQIRNNESLA